MKAGEFDWSKIDPHEFESIVADCFSKLGYSIFQTRNSADGGVDVIADRFDEATRSWLRFVIQVKRYSSRVGVEKVRELNGVLDDFSAVRGILVGTSGFTKASREFEKNHSNRLVLWDENMLLQLLEAADLLDAEGNLRQKEDPNLKSNRRNLICMVLREKRPKPMSGEAIASSLRSRYGVVVPDRTINQDLVELSEHGDIVEVESNLYCARVLDIELKEICDTLAEEISTWDFHFDERDLVNYIVKRYKIPVVYVLKYMQDSVTGIITECKRKGVLTQIGDRYFTEKGLERFRNTRLTEEQMRKNLIEFLGISKSDLKKPITTIFELNKPINLLDENDPRKKIIAFKQILPFKCTCGAFSISIYETIPIVIAPVTLKPRWEEFSIGHELVKGWHPETVREVLDCSSDYIGRLSELIANYKIGHDGVSAVTFDLLEMFAVLEIDLDLGEKSTVKEMIDSIIRESERFQNFLIDLNQPLEGWGLTTPIRTPLLERVSVDEENSPQVKPVGAKNKRTKYTLGLRQI